MKQTELKINVEQIYQKLKEANPQFRNKHLYDISEVNRTTIASWQNEAPKVIQLLWDLSKSFEVSFSSMVMNSSDLFPVIKVLKYFETETKIDCESVILKIE